MTIEVHSWLFLLKMHRLRIFTLHVMVLMYTGLTSIHASDLQEDKGKQQDVCLWETFQPRCSNSEVILMTSATYGRMQIGRCITAEDVDAQRSVTRDDPDVLGCSADVLSLLDRSCSGGAECNVKVFEIGNNNIRPCLPGLIVYMEVGYNCIKAADELRSCQISVSSDPSHIVFISNSSQRLCGQKRNPWLVRASVGQRLSVILFDFSSSASEQREGGRSPCHRHGVIVEKSLPMTTPICRIAEEREKEIYLSKSNSLEIIFDEFEMNSNSANERKLIIRIKAFGCSDILPPEDMWLKRNEDLMTIGCYNNRQMWRLNCTRDKWIGVVGNCSKEASRAGSIVGSEEERTSLSEKEQILAIVAICGFTLAICIAIVCVGAVCLRRFYLEGRKKQNYKTLNFFIDPTKACYETQRLPIEDEEKIENLRCQTSDHPLWMDAKDVTR